MQAASHVFLIATHILNEKVLKLYEEIRLATTGKGEVCILYHQKSEHHSSQYKNIAVHSFTDTILTELHYTPITQTLIPGSNHFSLLHYFKAHKQFSYYWYIENDVHFTGNWSNFFDAFHNLHADLVSAHIELYTDNPSWPWWNSLHHPLKNISLEQRVSSFNPVYRLSADALERIHNALLDGWMGHHEVLLPTLLYHNNFSLMDFGGNGHFVPPGFSNEFYTRQTFRWRPVFRMAGSLQNKLYHPVK
jgi:hypothetical protein